MNGKHVSKIILFFVFTASLAGCSREENTADNDSSTLAELSFSIQLAKEYVLTDTVTLSEICLSTLGTTPVFSGSQVLSTDPVEIDTQVEPTVTDSMDIILSLLVNGSSKELSGTYPSDTITEWTSGNQYFYYITINEDSLAFGAVQKSEWTNGNTLDLNIQ